MATKDKAKKKKIAKGITSGIAHIQASFNNTIITITDKQEMCWSGLRPALSVIAVRKNPLLLLLR